MTIEDMLNYELDMYMSNAERIASIYVDVSISDLFDVVEYQEDKRNDRGLRRDLRRSLKVVERYLRLRERYLGLEGR